MERSGRLFLFRGCRQVGWLDELYLMVLLAQDECDIQVSKVLALLQEERSLDNKVRGHRWLRILCSCCDSIPPCRSTPSVWPSSPEQQLELYGG